MTLAAGPAEDALELPESLVNDLTGTVIGVNARRSFVAVRVLGHGICLMQWLEGAFPEVGDILRGELLTSGPLRNVSAGWECDVIVHATECDRAAAARLLGK